MPLPLLVEKRSLLNFHFCRNTGVCPLLEDPTVIPQEWVGLCILPTLFLFWQKNSFLWAIIYAAQMRIHFPLCCCLFLKVLSSCVELCSQMQISIIFTMFAGWIPISVWTSRKVYHINIAGIQWEDQNPCYFGWYVKVCFCSWIAEILTSSSSSLSPANWNSSAQWFCTLMILWCRVNNQVNANHTTEIRMLQSKALIFG